MTSADELIGYGDLDASEFVGHTLASQTVSVALTVGSGSDRKPGGTLLLNVSSEVGEAAAAGVADSPVASEPLEGVFILTVGCRRFPARR